MCKALGIIERGEIKGEALAKIFDFVAGLTVCPLGISG